MIREPGHTRAPVAVGVRNIVVTTPGGTSPVVAADGFTYTASTT
jgi:hypothetical protein